MRTGRPKKIVSVDEDDYKNIKPNPPKVVFGEKFQGELRQTSERRSAQTRDLLYGASWIGSHSDSENNERIEAIEPIEPGES